MIFIEARVFTKLLPRYLSDDDYHGLQSYLINKPDGGVLVRGAGGVRKVRWSAEGRGKSGGIHILYYWHKSDSEIWMLTSYSKSEKASISSEDLKLMSEAIGREKS